tara:strand:+ start:2208 stop:2543 length:336 start_codon:yes stop_codon:yes gene_type:complete
MKPKNEYGTCPWCGGDVTKYPAISRLTRGDITPVKVCPPCGQMEAIIQWQLRQYTDAAPSCVEPTRSSVYSRIGSILGGLAQADHAIEHLRKKRIEEMKKASKDIRKKVSK